MSNVDEARRNGGPAFPVGTAYQGLTMRDYFAAKAMQALMTSDKYTGIIGVNNYEINRAKDAYAIADAMLKAREQ